MNRISIALPNVMLKNGKYCKMLQILEEELCCCYALGFPRNYVYTDEPLNKMKTTKLPSRISYISGLSVNKLLRKPEYSVFLQRIELFDSWASKKVASDESKVVFTHALMRKTILQAKNAGKIVILEAGNSEPEREYKRISAEYAKYDIHKQYIYGNWAFGKTCKESFEIADRIISISKVSENTYRNAGYDMRKFINIPLTGTDFPIRYEREMKKRKKAFITTGFHNFIKGTHRLLLAWRKAEISDVPLIIVGKICEDMQEFIDKNGPFENVEFVGHQKNLNKWYEDYDAVGVLLSLSEGAGRVTPEMMSFGFPMITSPDATCDIVIDGYNGKVVDPFTEKEIIDALKYFADDWSRGTALRENVFASVNLRTVKDFSQELGEFLLSIL